MTTDDHGTELSAALVRAGALANSGTLTFANYLKARELLDALEREIISSRLPDTQRPPEAALTPELVAGARDDLTEQALGRVTLITAEIAELNRQLDAAVGIARLLGTSWREIGERAGISPQAAHKRWSAKSEQAQVSGS